MLELQTLSPKLISALTPAATEGLEALFNDLNSLPFVKILQDSTSLVSEAERMLESVSWAEYLVTVGIGGSDLGGRAIQMALDHGRSDMEVIFFGESTDPAALDDLLSRIDLESTVFNFVSKSGGTVETMAQYFYLTQLLRDHTDDWKKHVVVTTDPTEGLLRKEVNEHNLQNLVIPTDLGGRFSVLSQVGIFSAAAMGVDVRELMFGAQRVQQETTDLRLKSVAAEIALWQYNLYEKGIEAAVMWTYGHRLSEFGRWWRQLWAESLGKQNLGILPIAARGPADQHSQLQYYTQGRLQTGFTFLTLEESPSQHIIEKVSIPEFDYLRGEDFAHILKVEADATAQSLVEAGKHVQKLTLSHLDAEGLGELFMTYELAVVILGKLFEINPFDQPGVEDSKRKIKESLSA